MPLAEEAPRASSVEVAALRVRPVEVVVRRGHQVEEAHGVLQMAVEVVAGPRQVQVAAVEAVVYHQTSHLAVVGAEVHYRLVAAAALVYLLGLAVGVVVAQEAHLHWHPTNLLHQLVSCLIRKSQRLAGLPPFSCQRVLFGAA